MTTRTKLALCAGLLAVAVGVAVELRSPSKSQLEVKFVRYAGNGAALLSVTNHGPSAVRLHSSDLFLWWSEYGVLPREPPLYPIILDPGRDMPVRTTPSVSESAKILVEWLPMRYRFSREIDRLFLKARINLAKTFVVTVNLPPRETNAPQPVTP